METFKKTNALRALDVKKIPYTVKTYSVDESDLSGAHAAAVLGLDPACVFKTIVTRSDKNGYFVFCVPVLGELDLKKCASVAGVKRLELLPLKDLLPLTGYLRGGCSPVGMKKKFPTVFHESVLSLSTVYLSAGLRGMQMGVSPTDILTFLDAKTSDLLMP